MKTIHSLILTPLLALLLVFSTQARALDEPWFSQAELDQMLAPIALYPDTVLSHVLIAATYPLEVIQAARWSRANPGLIGQDAVTAVEQMNWDPSVMALVAFPDLLTRLDEDIEWTHRLGDAFMVQEEEVVGTIQSLRDRAYAQGHLRSNEQVRVVREKEYIYIEPARTRVVHVPYYDPRVVYGNWWWSSYPPVYWHHPPRYVRGISFYWGPAYRIAPTFYFSSFHWSRRQVVVINRHHHQYPSGLRFHSGREVAHYKDARRWQHSPQHRRGVSYHRGVDQRHLARQAQAPSRRTAGAVHSVTTRSSQRSWAADRRDSIQLSGASAARKGEQVSRARARSAESNRITSSDTRATSARAPTGRSAINPASNRSTIDRPTTRTRSSQRSASAASVRDSLQRTAAPARSQAESTRQRTRSRVESMPSKRPDRQMIAPSRAAPESRGSRPAAPARSAPRSAPQRSMAPARSAPRSAPQRSMAPARSAPRSAPQRSMAPTRSAPRSAPQRSMAPTRSAPRSAPQRSMAPARSAPRSAPQRSTAPARSAARSAAPRSSMPARQSGSTRQRVRSPSSRDR